ncbi:hypothetical protein LSTR_LSTR003108 [Laodelphax striatellus]|uniref:Uncharacterized protein n=1 Tax=Laodelphax striatellus TaxID=195883 RepID=A0A482WVS4_LAOST|nr:hypothetical protein LSTR_LSTR003108 [Laodelphax striatellus]
MDSKFEAPLIEPKDTEKIPIILIEPYCTYEYCDKPFLQCRNSSSPGPATYNPKLPRKHIAEADFTKLTPRKTEVLPSYSVGPTSYNTHQYKSIKPIVDTHNVKVKQEAAKPRSFYTPRRRLKDDIYSHRYETPQLTTFINPKAESGFVHLGMEKELIRTSEEAAIVVPGER